MVTTTQIAPTGKNGSAPTKSVTAATLFDRKLKMAESLSCAKLFDELREADSSMVAKLAERAERVAQLGSLRAQVDDAKTLGILGVEGKNEAERNANRVVTLQKDPAYVQNLASVLEGETALATLDNELEEIKRRCRRTEKEIGYKTSVLEFLAG